MRRSTALIAVPIAVALLAGSRVAAAQGTASDRTVNDRMENRPFAAGSRAESYIGLTMTQLVVALGLRLQGVPPGEIRERLDEMRTRQSGEPGPPSTLAAGPPPHDAPPTHTPPAVP